MFGGFQVGAFQPLPAFQQVAGDTGAGRKRKYRDIYRVSIDGNKFEFKDYASAITFLEKTKAVAKQLAAAAVRESTNLPKSKPQLEMPKIAVSSRDLRGAVTETKRDIAKIYEQAQIDMDIAMLFELDRRAKEDDDLMLLM